MSALVTSSLQQLHVRYYFMMRAKIELANTDFLEFCLTRSVIKTMMVRTRAEHTYQKDFCC